MARIVYGTILDDSTNPLVGVGIRFTLVNSQGQAIVGSTIAQTGGVVEGVQTTTDANGEFSISIIENAIIQNETYYRVDVMPNLAGSVLYTSFLTYIGTGAAVTLRELAGVLPNGTSTIYQGATVIVVPTGVQPFGDPNSTLARVYGTALDASATPQVNMRIDFTLVNEDFQPVTGYLQDEVFSLVETTSTFTDGAGNFEAFIQGNTAIDSETYYKVHIHNTENEKFVASLSVGDDITLREFKAQGQAVTGEAKTLEGYIELARKWAEEYPDPVVIENGIPHYSSAYWAVAAANNATLGIQIDDNTIAPDKVWSSLKTNNEILFANTHVGSKVLDESAIQDGYIIHYNSFLDQLEYVPKPSGGGSGSSTFLDLTDTPASYSGAAGRIVVVKADETGVEYSTFTDPSLKADKVSGAVVANFAGLDAAGNLTDSGYSGTSFLPTGYQDSTKLDQVLGIQDGMVTIWLGDALASSNILFTDLANTSQLAFKADKVSGAVVGNFAGLTGVGNLTDSGYKYSDFATVSHTHSEFTTKMDKTSGVADGNIGILINDQTEDGGILVSDLAIKSELTGKADKVSGAVAGHLATLDASGNLLDSGIDPTTYSTRLDQVLDYTDISDISYTTAGKKEIVTYLTGNKATWIYNVFNNPSSIEYYDTDGTTLLHTQTMTYDVASANQVLKTTSWI